MQVKPCLEIRLDRSRCGIMRLKIITHGFLLIHQYTESGKIDGFNLIFQRQKYLMSNPQQPETSEAASEIKPEVKTEKPNQKLTTACSLIVILISLFKK